MFKPQQPARRAHRPGCLLGGTTHTVPLWACVSLHGEAGSWRLVLDRAESAGHPHRARHGG